MKCENNKAMKCPCTYNCSKRGKCCECIANHVAHNEFPACFFSKEGELKYDRSFEQLKKDRQ